MVQTLETGNGAVSLRTRAHALADELMSRIEDGAYGDKLPAERILAKEFSVPRHTVRDALDLLEGRGAIARRAGSGSFIVPVAAGMTTCTAGTAASAIVAENTSPLELQVVRGIFEPELVRLAVLYMSPRDLEALRRTIERLQTIRTDQDAFIGAEEELYLQLAKGTHNPLLIAIYELITEVRRTDHWRAQRKKLLAPRHIRERQDRHSSMFAAIEDRDIERAVEYARLLLGDEQRGLDK